MDFWLPFIPIFTGPDEPIDRTKEINRREASQT
jgi:hypothetical protein